MSQTVRVNFSRPMPLFPLNGTVLLPHAVQPLDIFEPRYRQMIEDSLDQSGQIALANYAGDENGNDFGPPLRPAVCVGQIIQHEKLDDGRHYILVHGVCRATIEEMLEPDTSRLYRLAKLVPLEALDQDPPPLETVRTSLQRLLAGSRLRRMKSVGTVLQWFDREDVPTHALLELVAFTLVQDAELKYRLLAEADAFLRARMIRHALRLLDRMVVLAEHQSYGEWPKGQSWN
jgi:Lon protease-like protein